MTEDRKPTNGTNEQNNLQATASGYPSECPGCGEEYIASTPEEARDPDRLCPPCFEEWPGLTLEELMKL